MRKRSDIRASSFVIWTIAVIALINFINLKFWNNENRVIASDVISYYAYLPAAFIYDDITFDFTRSDPAEFSNKFWPLITPDGEKVIKTTMGVSYFYIPGFIAGHIVAKLSKYEANGFTAPYRFFLQLGGIFALIISLWQLKRLLLDYFSERVTAITLLLICFATNLYYYSLIEGAFSHIYSFLLIILFIRETKRYYINPSTFSPALLGFTMGLITLIRPSNIIVLLIFGLWGICSITNMWERIKSLITNYSFLIIFAFFFVIPWIPQLIYWKTITGSWFFYSYLDERFFFANPHIIDGLFSFRKGLFVYTPIVLLMWLGTIFLKGELKKYRIALVSFTIINCYLIFSWWCWWYGGSFGQRPFIDSYGLYALPLAALIDYSLRSNNIKKFLISGSLVLLLFYGIFQTYQYYHGAIHWDSMTKSAWLDSFGRLKPSENFHSLIREPDYEKARTTGKE